MSGPPALKMLLAAVKQAHLYAKAAVGADEKQDYSTALANYRQVLAILKAEVQNAPPDDQSAFHDRILVYSRRVELIELMNPSLKKEEVADAGQLDFKEEPIATDPFPEEVPDGAYQRPYWMMRLFIKTMTTGAFLTPRLYIHKGVWFQQNVKIDSYHVKLGACFPVLEDLQKLSHCAIEDTVTIASELEAFCEKLILIQNTLAQSLPFIAKARVDEKLMKQMKKVLEKGAVAMTPSEKHGETNYMQALMGIFKESQFLESWHKHFAATKTSPEILLMLGAVSDYFNTVMCPMVLRDLNTLLDKYMRRSLTQLSRGAL